jgi:hypothetical protein
MPLDELEPVELLAQKIERAIQNENWEELLTTTSAAETYLSDRVDLMFHMYSHCGEYRQSQFNYDSAIPFFSRSRKYNPTSVDVFNKLIECFSSFFSSNKDLFIKADLEILVPTIKMLVDYYKNLPPVSASTVRTAEELVNRLEYRIQFVAQDTVEGKMTFRTQKIVNALEQDVPMEQVKTEVGKLIADLIKKKIKESKGGTEKKK